MAPYARGGVLSMDVVAELAWWHVTA